MSHLTRRLTIAELSERILEMAKTGVYRASVFETFQPVATQRNISLAIRHCKKFGLHSVAKMRDSDLGTYYQTDVAKYQSLHSELQKTVPIASEEDLLKRVSDTVLVLQMMLTIAGAGAIALFGVGIVCLTSNKPQLGWGLVSSAISVLGIWVVQRAIAKKVL
jgi:hypothetical protein